MKMFTGFWIAILALQAHAVFPGKEWETRDPSAVGLDRAALDHMAEFMGGRGCVVRHGYMAYTWGDANAADDVASACKPWVTHFLLRAVEEHMLPSPNARVVDYAPCLADLNPGLGHKDRQITFAHMANQVSCYGVREAPGTAFDYNDYQLALYFDTLFLKVYKVKYETLDADVLHKRLTDTLQCQDEPTFFAFHREERAGRLAVSPRDFARFGLLYLHEGDWNGTRLLSREHARMAVSSPVSNAVPRTKGEEAQMCEGQRTLGSQRVPDNQTDHYGSYTWNWWINGTDKDGKRHWPDAPTDVFAALGHHNGMRGMAVFPSLDLIVSYNDSAIGEMRDMENPLNEGFKRLVAAVTEKSK